MHRIIELSLKYRFLVIVLACLAVGIGIRSLQRLPIDAVPDITPNQVLILTRAPGLGPVEVERFITFPVETAMSGLPGIENIRSVSRFGLSAVTIFFKEDMEMYFCRRLVMERLPQAKEMIPPGFGNPEMGPISTGLGEIYQFEVKGAGYSAMDLRSILEWDIAFKLRSVPGIVEVNTYGGQLKTYEVQVDADKLTSYNLSLQQVMEALQRNNFSTGGAYIEHNQEQQVIRGEGLIESISDIENIVLGASQGGVPVYVKHIATVAFAPRVRQGAVTRDGRGEVVTGVVMMLMGENSRVVAQRAKDKLKEIQKSLPAGVTASQLQEATNYLNAHIRGMTLGEFREWISTDRILHVLPASESERAEYEDSRLGHQREWLVNVAWGADPVAGVRTMLDGGMLRSTGRITHEGRSVLRLVGEEPGTEQNGSPGGPIAYEYLVEPYTFAPVRASQTTTVRAPDENGNGAERYVVAWSFPLYERLPLDASTQHLLVAGGGR